jgi:hypothetical protein
MNFEVEKRIELATKEDKSLTRKQLYFAVPFCLVFMGIATAFFWNFDGIEGFGWFLYVFAAFFYIIPLFIMGSLLLAFLDKEKTVTIGYVTDKRHEVKWNRSNSTSGSSSSSHYYYITIGNEEHHVTYLEYGQTDIGDKIALHASKKSGVIYRLEILESARFHVPDTSEAVELNTKPSRKTFTGSDFFEREQEMTKEEIIYIRSKFWRAFVFRTILSPLGFICPFIFGLIFLTAFVDEDTMRIFKINPFQLLLMFFGFIYILLNIKVIKLFLDWRSGMKIRVNKKILSKKDLLYTVIVNTTINTEERHYYANLEGGYRARISLDDFRELNEGDVLNISIAPRSKILINYV